MILKWLASEYDSEIVAYVADVGQEEDLEEVERKAWDTGASAVFIEDLREEFARDYVFPAVSAGAVYEGSYLLGTSIARPLIAKRQIEIAEREGAFAVSHGATGKGNDQVRFELTFPRAQSRHKDHSSLAGVELQVENRPRKLRAGKRNRTSP